MSAAVKKAGGRRRKGKGGGRRPCFKSQPDFFTDHPNQDPLGTTAVWPLGRRCGRLGKCSLRPTARRSPQGTPRPPPLLGGLRVGQLSLIDHRWLGCPTKTPPNENCHWFFRKGMGCHTAVVPTRIPTPPSGGFIRQKNTSFVGVASKT